MNAQTATQSTLGKVAAKVSEVIHGKQEGSIQPEDSALERKLKAQLHALKSELTEQVQFMRSAAKRCHELGAEGRTIESDLLTRSTKLEQFVK